MQYIKPNGLIYRIAQGVSWVVAKVIFRRVLLRDEIRDLKGPFVVIANHQSKLDFVNLIGVCKRPMSFVISKSFYRTLPITGILRRMGVIPKQQFQTTVADMKKMKSVIDHGQPLVIYPAGLMCEDGLSTPIPKATYKFLKWLDADVYVARSYGTYFVMPKWAKNIRPGKTYMDVYKLFSKEELKELSVEQVQEKADEALLFDAYREQERIQTSYSDDIEGLENVLYLCPHCHKEFTIKVKNKNTLYCDSCGYELVSDNKGFLRNDCGFGPDIRYVSDWSKLIFEEQKNAILNQPELRLETPVQILMINEKKHKFCPVGQGILSLKDAVFDFAGVVNGQQTQMHLPVTSIPTLPFTPGKHLEIQQGDVIYRCVPQEGRLVTKLINMVKIFHQLSLSKTA